MAIIPRKENKVLKIEKLVEEKLIKEEFRPHLGASIIGDRCLRKVWYSFRWSKERYIIAKQKRLFSRGHAEELIVIEDLINAGCQVEGINIDESIKKRFKTLFKHDLPEQKQISGVWAYGFGGASCDGRISKLPDAPKTKHLFECKALNLKSFTKIKNSKEGLRGGNYHYYVQINIYMRLFKLKRCLFVAVHKDTDERYYERIKLDKTLADLYLEKGERVIKNFDTPFDRCNKSKESFPCSWINSQTKEAGYCDFYEICWSSETPAKNCRTCNNIGLRADEKKLNGHFICEKTGKELSHKKQLKGCKNYKLSIAYL